MNLKKKINYLYKKARDERKARNREVRRLRTIAVLKEELRRLELYKSNCISDDAKVKDVISKISNIEDHIKRLRALRIIKRVNC